MPDAVKRAVLGFKSIYLAPITTNTAASYVTGAGVALPYAGALNRTAKEVKQDIEYDGTLYAQYREVLGEEVELRIGDATPAILASLGLGTVDAASGKFEGDFSPTTKYFALRFIEDTVGKVPNYLCYRVFEVTGVRKDNVKSKPVSGSVAVSEVIITGALKKPELTTLKPWAMLQLAADGSNQTACDELLTAAETVPTT